MRKINLKNVVWKEGKYYVAWNINTAVSSFGKTKKEAVESLQEALELHFEDKMNGRKIAGEAVLVNLMSTMTPELENLLGKIEYDIQKGENLSQVIASKKELKDYFVSI